jgi:2-polyprenyl-3-methyl-5-hydroxy-6-metoxy-1,4-benzoquinol methylase
MDQYIFERNWDDREWERLRLIEQALDDQSIASLQATGIRREWDCLELGAGAGSIAQWMSNVVGDVGRVVAIDLKTDFLLHLSTPPCEVVQGDFLSASLEGRFDLAHCRYVLVHNRQSQSMLEKLGSLLKPGGILVVEEPDFTSARLLNRDTDHSQQRVNNAICRMFDQMQLDPAFGLAVPHRVSHAGLEVREVDARMHFHHGGDTLARMMGHSTNALREKYIATGEADAVDIEKYIENSMNPTFWAMYYSTVTVVARRLLK